MERDLFQARVKSISSLLGYNAKQVELCRSQLASILSTSTMNKCQELIDKVSEFRYLKVRERQINKYNSLLHKKEGNITWSVPTSTLVNSTLPAVSASSPQAGSIFPQAIIIASQVGSNSQAGSQVVNNIRQAVSSSQAGSQVIGSSNSANSSNPQAVSANSQRASTVPPRQVVPRQTVLVPGQSVLSP